jgi:hypothetical protein
MASRDSSASISMMWQIGRFLGRVGCVCSAMGQPCETGGRRDAWATGYQSVIIGERFRANIEEQNPRVAGSDRSRKPTGPERRGRLAAQTAAQDGAATALNRILSR